MNLGLIISTVMCFVSMLACTNTQNQLEFSWNESSNEGKRLVFVAGYDEGDNMYYENARVYFQEKRYQIVDSVSSLQEIIEWINTYENAESLEEIHVVSHSNPWRGLSLKTTVDGDRISKETLYSAMKLNKLPELSVNFESDLKFVFHSCGLGENEALLHGLKQSLGGTEKLQVYASPLFNVFGGKYAPHYLAKVYYTYYPTAESPGRYELAKQLKAKYGNTLIDWNQALKTKTETDPGVAYTYKFNIPAEWEFEFDSVKDIPLLESRDDIMDWVVEVDDVVNVIEAFNIPLEQFRWRSKIQDNKLFIYAKTTVVCIMEPVMDEIETKEYQWVRLDNKKLYTSF